MLCAHVICTSSPIVTKEGFREILIGLEASVSVGIEH